MSPECRILHHSNYVATQGGMQAIIRSHLHCTLAEQLAVGFRDRARSVGRTPGLIALNTKPWMPVGRVRNHYRSALAHFSPQIGIYHNAWGASLVGPADPSMLKVAYLHASFPRLEQLIRAKARHFDAFICISPALHSAVLNALPGWPEERCILLKSPVNWPTDLHRLRTRPRSRCIIGISGRIAAAQKRLDRLPELVGLCDAYLDSYEIQVLGSGPLESLLQRRLGSHPKVRFLGWREGPAYWETIASWRYLLSLSDFEGLPLTLLEAAGVGALPIYPDFCPGTPASVIIPRELLYPKGNLEAAVQRIARLEREYGTFKALWMDASARELADHGQEVYHKSFCSALSPSTVDSWAPLPRPRAAASGMASLWPFAVYHWRMKRLRYGNRGIVFHR